jgi:hypothetical protein
MENAKMEELLPGHLNSRAAVRQEEVCAFYEQEGRQARKRARRRVLSLHVVIGCHCM